MSQFSLLAIGVFYGRMSASSGKGPVEENERMTKMDKAVVFRDEIDAAAEGFAALVAAYEERMRAASPGAEVASDWESPADAVSAYLNVEFSHLTRALECLKACDSDEHAAALGDAMGEGFLELDRIVAEGWSRFGIVPCRDFGRTALIVNSVFKPGAFREKGTPSVFGGRVDSVVFRRMAVDRVCDALRDVLVWLRNDSRMIDRLVVRR